MIVGDFAELTGEHNDCHGLCEIVAVEGRRVTVRTETGKVVTVHARGLNKVPGPEELKQRATAIREQNLIELAESNPKPRVRPDSVPNFVNQYRQGVGVWRHIA